MNTLGDIGEFLYRSLSQKEVSLIIAASGGKAEEAVQELKSNGFSSFKKLGDIEQGGKHYFLVDATSAKRAYDLAREYGTGQITCFNTATSTPAWATPTYKGSAFVLVIVKSDLVSAENEGLNFLSASGLAFQFA